MSRSNAHGHRINVLQPVPKVATRRHTTPTTIGNWIGKGLLRFVVLPNAKDKDRPCRHVHPNDVSQMKRRRFQVALVAAYLGLSNEDFRELVRQKGAKLHTSEGLLEGGSVGKAEYVSLDAVTGTTASEQGRKLGRSGAGNRARWAACPAGHLAVEDVAELKGVSTNTVRRRHADGLLPAVSTFPLRFAKAAVKQVDPSIWTDARLTRRESQVAQQKQNVAACMGIRIGSLLTRREIAAEFEMPPESVENWVVSGWLQPIEGTNPRLFLRKDANRAKKKAETAARKARKKRQSAARAAAAQRKANSGYADDAPWIDVEKASDRFGWHPGQIRRWMNEGWPVPGIRIRTRKNRSRAIIGSKLELFAADLQTLFNRLSDPPNEEEWVAFATVEKEFATYGITVRDLHNNLTQNERWPIRVKKMPTRLADGRVMNVWRAHRGELESHLDHIGPEGVARMRGNRTRDSVTGLFVRAKAITAAAPEPMPSAARSTTAGAGTPAGNGNAQLASAGDGNGESKPNNTPGESLDPNAFYSAAEIASALFGADDPRKTKSIKAKLRRLRESRQLADTDMLEVADRRARQPQFRYRWGAVKASFQPAN
jgi:hypothetical protein